MPRLNLNQLKAARAFLLNPQAESLTYPLWRSLHEREDLGRRQGQKLILSASDRAQLRRWYRENTGQDPEHPLPQGDRLETARQFANEKLTPRGVFADHWVMAAPRTALPLRPDKVWSAPYPGALPCVHLDYLDPTRIEKILLIENGSLVGQWWDWVPRLPPFWQEALLLHRGYGRNLAALKHLLQQLPAACSVGYFPDCDPAGLTIAAGLAQVRALRLLLPQYWETLHRQHPKNRPDLWARQHLGAQARQLLTQNPRLAALVAHMDAEQLALTQEHILEFGAFEEVQIFYCTDGC